MSYMHGSQGKVKPKKSNRNLCIVRAILWIRKVIWEDNVDRDKYVYEHLRKGMEERKKKANLKCFPPLLISFSFNWGMQPYEWEEEEELDLESQERLLHRNCLETMGFQAVLEEAKKQ